MRGPRLRWASSWGTKGIKGAVRLPSGELLTWSMDRTLRVWDLASRQATKVLAGHRGAVTDATLLSGNRVASFGTFSGDQENTLIIWDLATRQPLAKLEDPSRAFKA